MEKIRHALRDTGIKYQLAYEEMYQKGRAHREAIAQRSGGNRTGKRVGAALAAAGKRVARVFDLVANKLRGKK